MKKLVSVRHQSFINQLGRCFYCTGPMWFDNPAIFASRYKISLRQASQFQCTAEHLTARKDGGSNSQSNIVAACLCCNSRRHQRKSDLSPDRYKALVKSRIEANRWHPPQILNLIAL